MLAIPPDVVPTLRVASGMGLLPADLTVDGQWPGVDGFVLPPMEDLVFGPESLQHLARPLSGAQGPSPDMDLCKLCGECLKICPAKAIEKTGRTLQFHYDRCIRCYCCQEICPYGAIRKKDNQLAKVVRAVGRKNPVNPLSLKIISGGQTGVDRAALDAALALKLPYGGYVPKGRKAEDGPIDRRYVCLTELDTDRYAVRTERNVFEGDATLILTVGKPKGGTAYTAACARIQRKPHLLVDLEAKKDDEVVRLVKEWLYTNPAGEPERGWSTGIAGTGDL